jgi:hypothetical protein
MGNRCLQSRPRGPAPKISPARKGWIHRQAVERRRCSSTTLFVCSLGQERTRIFSHKALYMATCAAFVKQSRMKDRQRRQTQQEVRASVVERSAVSF